MITNHSEIKNTFSTGLCDTELRDEYTNQLSNVFASVVDAKSDVIIITRIYRNQQSEMVAEATVDILK